MRLRMLIFVLPLGCAGIVGTVPDVGPDAGTSIAAPDAGSISDAGIGDSGTPTVDAGDPCAGSLLCDDFESYAVGTAPAGPWSADLLGSGTVQVDTTHAYGGTKSVRFTVDANKTSQRAYMSTQSAKLFPVPGGVMYGRMMVWLEQIPILSNGPHWTTVAVSGPTDPATSPAGITWSTYNYGVMQTLLANYQDSSYPDCYAGSSTTLPVQTWTCVEWLFDTPGQRLRLWLNGQGVDQVSVDHTGQGCVNAPATHTWMGPNANVLDLGIELYQASNIQIQYWIDDVAVGTSRLGCPH